MGKKKTFHAGDVFVETGMIYIGDPMYVVAPEGDQEEMPDWEEFTKRVAGGEHKAEGELPDVASEPLGKGGGIVMPSGWGDGIYPVYITLGNDGRPEAAMIIFNTDG